MQKNTCLLVFALLMLTHFSFSQKMDSTKRIYHFGGSVAVTNNGISLIPTFSLGEPAAIFNLSMGKGKLSFEPEIKFSLEGKPWSFLFWWRYKLLKADRFVINTGIHPALSFRTITSPIDSSEILVARRYLAAELVPYYLLTKNISVGLYYLYSRGFGSGTTKSNHFLTVNINFSHIKLSNQFFIKLVPQVYYLKLDEQDGFYYTAALTLAKNNFPFTIQSIMNKIIDTDVDGSKNFVWNISLIYSFNKRYVKI